jgi:hypothetical protein
LFGLDGSLPPFPNPADTSGMFVAGVGSWYDMTQTFLPWLFLGIAVVLLLAALLWPVAAPPVKLKAEPAAEANLRKHGLLTRDSRMVERKKYGRRGARRGCQFSKR